MFKHHLYRIDYYSTTTQNPSTNIFFKYVRRMKVEKSIFRLYMNPRGDKFCNFLNNNLFTALGTMKYINTIFMNE